MLLVCAFFLLGSVFFPSLPCLFFLLPVFPARAATHTVFTGTGNFPYPSNYLTMGGPLLPAYPVRATCEELKTPNLQSTALLEALNRGASVFNNATQDLSCFQLPEDTEDDGIWDYQWCTELLPQESYFSLDGKKDMFWSQPYNTTFIHERCQREFGILPRNDWIRDRYGDMPRALSYTSNIVLSNGLYGAMAAKRLSGGASVAWPLLEAESHCYYCFFLFSYPNPFRPLVERWRQGEHLRHCAGHHPRARRPPPRPLLL